MKMSVSTEMIDLEFLEIFQDQKLKEREKQLSVYLKELRNYILRIIRVWSFFFNTGLSWSAFSTYYFGTLVFRLSVFDVISVCSEILIRSHTMKL